MATRAYEQKRATEVKRYKRTPDAVSKIKLKKFNKGKPPKLK